MGLEESIIAVLREGGEGGATASQIARRLGRKREVVSHYLWLLKKMGRAFNRERNIWALREEGLDPFDVSPQELERLPFEEYVKLAERALKMCRGEVEGAFEDSSVHHVVVSGGRIVHRSKDAIGLTLPAIRSLAERGGRACYIFSREDLVEEARWTRLDGDHYPAVTVFLGGKDWADDRVFKQGIMVTADLDTGNPYYHIFDEGRVAPLTRASSILQFHRGIHLGRPYWYFVGEVKVGVQDVDRRTRARVVVARFVRDWGRSPLLLANPRRSGFTGRRLLFSHALKVTLNPRARLSRMELL